MKYLKNMNLQLKNVTVVFDFKSSSVNVKFNPFERVDEKKRAKEFARICKRVSKHTTVKENDIAIVKCKVWDKDESKPLFYIDIPALTNKLERKKEGDILRIKWDGKIYHLVLKQLGTRNGYATFEQTVGSFSSIFSKLYKREQAQKDVLREKRAKIQDEKEAREKKMKEERMRKKKEEKLIRRVEFLHPWEIDNEFFFRIH